MTSEETPPPGRHTARNVLLTLVAVVLLSLGIWMTPPGAVAPPVAAPASPPAPVTAPETANSLPVVAGIGGDFRLPSTTGKELSFADLRGKVVLINFGFTSCADVCPMVLTRLGNVLRTLDNQIDLRRVQPLFITFDPDRDTLDVLGKYVTFFHPTLIGLRGDAAQTAAVAKQYKAIYLKQDSASAGGYVFQHSDFVYVLDTKGRVRLLVGSQDPDEAIVEAVRRLLREDEGQ